MEICIMCIVNVSNIYHFLFFTCTKVDEQHPQMWSPGSSSLSHAGSFLLQLYSEVVDTIPKFPCGLFGKLLLVLHLGPLRLVRAEMLLR